MPFITDWCHLYHTQVFWWKTKKVVEKFGGDEKRRYLCNTRTRQASLRCLNRRVVLLYYGSIFKIIFVTSPIGVAVAISWTFHWECNKNRELSSPYRLLQIQRLSLSSSENTKGKPCFQVWCHVQSSLGHVSFWQTFAAVDVQRNWEDWGGCA